VVRLVGAARWGRRGDDGGVRRLTTTVTFAELEAILHGYVGQQRWYAGGAEDQIVVHEVDVLAPPWPALLWVGIGSPRGDRYQVLLGLRPAGEPVDAPIGALVLPEGPAVVVDATTDPELALLLLRTVAKDRDVSVARPMGVEQTNTSIVYDERFILKVFRRLAGRNPEVEVTVALAQVGFTHVAEPLAVWRHGQDDLGIVQPFLVGGLEGWALSQTSLRVLFDDTGDPAASGADFAPEASRLGEMTADMHLAFAEAFGAVPGDTGVWADAIRSRVRWSDLPPVDEGAIAACLDNAATIQDAGASIRIHGDYHLGQVMRTDDGWFVLDFEGEPVTAVEERTAPSSPLRDVAGMLRSFSYAAAVAVRNRGDQGCGEPARQWEARNREAFLDAYFNRLDGSPLLPSVPSVTRVLLDLFELDKALYEVAYELDHRPEWVGIPLAAVQRLLGDGAKGAR
jgi:maltokinase